MNRPDDGDRVWDAIVARAHADLNLALASYDLRLRDTEPELVDMAIKTAVTATMQELAERGYVGTP